MSGNLRLYNSSGYVELQAPASATSQVLELPTDSIKPGMVLISEGSFSGVSEFAVDDCFSNNYRNYRVCFSLTSSAAANTYLRFRSSGVTDSGASNYSWQYIIGNGTSLTASSNLSVNSGFFAAFSGTGNSYVLDFFNPFSSSLVTSVLSDGSYGGTGIYRANIKSIVTNSYDGFLITTFGSATIDGNYSIYGYRNS
jgi:hypothetical protein